ncbi:MAG: tetratricopeptide repeat protein [Magnetococcales bacterium]|nr:tetratricopeptide repeat protein [Magnetococcales bacterium]
MSIYINNSRYNPQLMTAEDLERLFVGRENLIEEVMDGLTASIVGEGKHFFLLIGPRGSGKTHFVHLIANRMRENKETDGKFLLAHFKEEEWEIDSYLEFLLQILHSLGQEKGGKKFLEEEANIRAGYNSKNHAASVRATEKSLIKFTNGKTLLLICENLADLLAGLGSDGQWKWRSFIQEHPFWTILAASPSLSESIRKKESSFYGFFNINNLGPLANGDEVVDLLKKRAIGAGTKAGEELAESLETPLGRARAGAIHHLSGGNHRACVTLFPFLTKESLYELTEPFAKMVDDLTPYYQSRIKDLSPGQRKITSFLARMHKPTAVGDVASHCLMTPQTAAKEIARLGDHGVVLRHKRGKKTLCELAEPLMRLCFEVKDNRSEYLQLFVDLLRGWFSVKELQERHDKLDLGLNGHVDLFDLRHIKAAVAEFNKDGKEPFLDALDDEGRKCWLNQDYEGAFAAGEKLIKERGSEVDYINGVSVASKAGKSKEGIRYAEKGLSIYPRSIGIRNALGLLLLDDGNYENALNLAKKMLAEGFAEDSLYLETRAHLGNKNYKISIKIGLDLIKQFPENTGVYFYLSRAYFNAKQFIDAEKNAEKCIKLNGYSEGANIVLATALALQGKNKKSIKVLKSTKPEHFDFKYYYLIGFNYFNLGQFQSSIKNLNFFLEKDPNNLDSLLLLSVSYYQTEQWEEALTICKRLNELKYFSPANSFLIVLCLIKLNRYIESWKALLSFEEVDDEESLHRSLMVTSELNIIGYYDDAINIAKSAIAFQPTSIFSHTALIYSQLEAQLYDEAVNSLIAARSSVDSSIFDLFECEIHAKDGNISKVSSLLRSVNNDKQIKVNVLQTHLTRIIKIAIRQFGPSILPTYFTMFRKELAPQMKRKIVGGTITELISVFILEFQDTANQWHDNLIKLEESIRDLKQSKLPLRMLRAAVERAKEGNDGPLLELPLEERKLLQDLIVKTEEISKRRSLAQAQLKQWKKEHGKGES